MAMTNDDFLAAHGRLCPACRSSSIQAEKLVFREGGTITQDVDCNACYASWVTTYGMLGYSELTEV